MDLVSNTTRVQVEIAPGTLRLGLRSETLRSETLRCETLRCEMLEAPLGVESAQPRLSWTLAGTGRGVRQAAYQILVATTPELLRAGDADLWDSGRVVSDQSLLVDYGGKPLESSQRVFWTVRVWDGRNRESAFAEPSQWTMGLRSPAEWKAKWIGPPVVGESAFEGASWIWYQAADPREWELQDKSGSQITFERTFWLPAGGVIRSAELNVASHAGCRVSVNGAVVGTSKDWQEPGRWEIAGHLRAGENNRLVIQATKASDPPGRAGCIAALKYSTCDEATGQETAGELVSDDRWVATAPGGKPESARVIGAWGTSPWGRIGLPQRALPLLRHRFEVGKQVDVAIAHVAGLGQYRLYLNGKAARDTVLDQVWSSYEKTVYYDTYDVTRLLKGGSNALGLMLAKGLYTNSGDRRTNGGVYERPLRAIVQLEIRYTDGTVERVLSGEGWRCREGPYRHNSILGGCDYDARELPRDWAEAGCSEEGWSAACVEDAPIGRLTSALSPPLRAFEEFEARAIEEPAPGVFVYDFGQNASATFRLRIAGKAGQTVRLTYAEQRHGASLHANDGRGRVNQSGIRSPNYVEYTCAGDGGVAEEWFCDLFYSGFQYVEVTGAAPAGAANPLELPVIEQLASVHVRADAPPVGSLACSNSDYLRIDRAIDWAVRSNLSYVLTDCPHREKMGWLEVSYLMWPSIAMKYDLSAFGPKVCRDIRDTQRDDGMIPTVAPSFLPDGYHFGGTSNPFTYTPEWGAAGVVLPWYCYAWYGDLRTLRESYASMCAFVAYMRRTCGDGLVPQSGLGDWYDYGHGHAPAESRFTPADLTAMATFHLCAQIVSQAATVLQHHDDAEAYRALSGLIAREFNRRCFNSDSGEYRNLGSCQTANAMALVCGLVDDRDRARVADAIVNDLKRRNDQQTSGDVGFHYLVRALADTGHSDVLFRILNRTDLGSYAYLVNAGWTSLPESWDAYSHCSMNHCMLGHVQEWLAMNLGGIQLSAREGAAAFKRSVIRPVLGPGVTSAGYTFQSPYGEIQAQCEVRRGVFHLDVTVPCNTEADVFVPAAGAEAVREGDRLATDRDDLPFLGMSEGNAVFRVGSGRYRFRAPASGSGLAV